MDDVWQAAAERLGERLRGGDVGPAELRRAIEAVPPPDRDVFVDRALALEPPPDDGPALPRGCVPYLPSAYASVARALDAAGIGPGDRVVDVGAGVGRAAALLGLLSGAAVVGLEVQPALAAASRALSARLPSLRYEVRVGDAVVLSPDLDATVYFLYCPFDRAWFERWLDTIEPAARSRPTRVACVDVMPPPRGWLRAVATSHDVVVVSSAAPG